jgi:hypothetical protein
MNAGSCSCSLILFFFLPIMLFIQLCHLLLVLDLFAYFFAYLIHSILFHNNIILIHSNR